MQCNKAYCGNGFTNGPFYSPCNAPLPCSQSFYPEIVGEGEVTSVTLPDGTIQFFFMPTVKWWSSNATQYQPNIGSPIFANPNMNMQYPQYNNNAGTWFVRSITNPLPQNMFNQQWQRSEVPRVNFNSDYNMNTSNNGYQLKFHNDNWTSTTDLHYFCPSLRQQEYVVKAPCKGTTPVQIDTVPIANNTVCHYEFVCSKPCHCTKPMSLECLVDPKPTTKSRNDSTDDLSRHKRCKEDKNTPNNVCACESTPKIKTSEKAVTTYIDEGCSCKPVDGRQTQTSEEKKKICFKKIISTSSCDKNTQKQPFKNDNLLQRCEVNKAETWKPISPLSRRAVEDKSSENSIEISDHEYNSGCYSNCSCDSG